MRRERIDPEARGFVCAVKREMGNGCADNIRTRGRHDPHPKAEDMTAPTIIAAHKNYP
jgi:hypothetical protein